ncbi:hypothetical protein MMC19_005116 [Ptychographa xylographoides]|nr:hypothetical protein [Ptychographa xylographoides]
MAHTSSRSWVSPLEATHERWITVKDNLNRVRFDRSPFVPQAFSSYLEHLASLAEDLARDERRRLALLETEGLRTSRAHYPWIIPFQGKKFDDNRSAVLGQSSIWSLWYQTPINRPDAVWPTPDEFREEGDERHTSGFGRFLPLPRVPGNETVAWKQKAFLDAYPLDCVNPVFWREPFATFLAEEEQDAIHDLVPDLSDSGSDGLIFRMTQSDHEYHTAHAEPESPHDTGSTSDVATQGLNFEALRSLLVGNDGTEDGNLERPKQNGDAMNGFNYWRNTPSAISVLLPSTIEEEQETTRGNIGLDFSPVVGSQIPRGSPKVPEMAVYKIVTEFSEFPCLPQDGFHTLRPYNLLTEDEGAISVLSNSTMENGTSMVDIDKKTYGF